MTKEGEQELARYLCEHRYRPAQSRQQIVIIECVLEMIKKSGGGVGELENLRKQAMEGVFDTRFCIGLEGCPFIPPELLEPVKDAIKRFKREGSEQTFKDIVKELK